MGKSGGDRGDPKDLLIKKLKERLRSVERDLAKALKDLERRANVEEDYKELLNESRDEKETLTTKGESCPQCHSPVEVFNLGPKNWLSCTNCKWRTTRK